MSVTPNMHLIPRVEPLPGRPLRDYQLLWPRAGRVLVVQRVRLNTKRVMALRMNRKVLSDVWWPIHLSDDLEHRDELEKALVLWLNSTPGIFLLLGMREETEGAWVQFKKPMWEGMPVLDVPGIRSSVRRALARTFDQLARAQLEYLPQIEQDPVRRRIDDAISDALGLPDLAPLRAALASEPLLRQNMGGILIEQEA